MKKKKIIRCLDTVLWLQPINVKNPPTNFLIKKGLSEKLHSTITGDIYNVSAKQA